VTISDRALSATSPDHPNSEKGRAMKAHSGGAVDTSGVCGVRLPAMGSNQ
jgi:hypothetical protein